MALSWTSSFQSRSAKDPLGASQAENAGSIPVARSRQTPQVGVGADDSTDPPTNRRIRRRATYVQHAGFQVLLIGGWAEELQGLADRRQHEDIDVVLLDPSADALEAFVAERDEVVEKRLSQKRAYRANGVLVELFVAMSTDSGYQTVWWDRIRWSWDSDMS
jgi:hypothetical protein